MTKNKTKARDERTRTNECPNGDVAMPERWHNETDWYGELPYARRGQCLETFVLTTDGWEEAAGYARDERD